MKYLYLNLAFCIFIVIFSIFNSELFFITKNISSYQDDRSYSSEISESLLTKKHPFKISLFEGSIVNKISLKFNLTIKNESYNFGNIFQTSDDLNSIRIELQPNNKLLLFIHNELFNVDYELESNKSYNFNLQFYENIFNLKINNKTFNFFPEHHINDIAFNEFYIGTGYSRLRNFLGDIDSISIDSNYKKEIFFISILKFFFFLSCLHLLFVFCKKNLNLINIQNNSKSKIIDTYFLYGLLILLSLIGVFSGIIFFSNFNIQPFKWFLYLIFPLLIFLSKNLTLDINKFFNINFLTSILLVLIIFIVGVELKVSEFLIIFQLSFLLFSPFIIISSVYLTNLQVNTFFRLTFFYLILFSSLSALVSIPNYQNIFLIFTNNYFLFIFGTLIFSFCYSYIFYGKQIINKNFGFSFLKKLIFFLFLLISLYLSFRSDSLFIDGSEYHWQYYLGPIIGLLNGHSLLWDVPSQYGFLNILLPSIINVSSPWQSLYLFQSILLLIISLILLLISYFKLPFSYFIFFVLLSFLSLFFADPSYIGPSPYPSSSVMRFFFVYIFIFYFLLFDHIKKNDIYLISFIWFLSFLWSAESAFYGSIIFLSIFITYLKNNYYLVGKNNLIRYFILLPSFLLFLFVIFYKFIYSTRMPDVLGHFEYALGYSSGHGYVPLSFPGPILYLALLFIFIFSFRFFSKESYLYICLLASLWSISSYYLGRPVPNNITAILPILCILYFSIFIFELPGKSKFIFDYSYCLFLPLLFAIFIPVIDIKWIDKISSLKSYNHDISMNREHTYPQLNQILTNLNIKHNAQIIYYGNDAAFPYLPEMDLKSKPWLPIPLQLIESPISTERRFEYLHRYYCSESNDYGLLIKNNSHGIEDRFNIINKDLQRLYYFKTLYSDKYFDIYEYKKKIGINCAK